MLNNYQSNTIAAECFRLQRNLSQRGFRRFMGRLFSAQPELEVVFDLQAGDSPKKSVFERMAAYAEEAMTTALDSACHFTLLEKKRSPKSGKVSYRLQPAFSDTATQYQLHCALRELEQLADACVEVDTRGVEMFRT